MKTARNILSFFISIKTAILLLFALLFLLLYGSVIMPANEEFGALNTVPLFHWMKETKPAITWWLWGAVGILSLLTTNTIVCSIESVVRKRRSRQWLLVIAPQVIHIGFLFILLAHLLSSYDSFRGTAYVYRGTSLQLPNGLEVFFEDIKTKSGPSGYITDWSADIRYYGEGRLIGRDVIRPNDPSFRNGLGMYVKTVKLAPFPVALVEVSREPGAPWALAGGIFFLIGAVALTVLKIRIEEKQSDD
jgi:cytochrome c biogenesis protein ResB